MPDNKETTSITITGIDSDDYYYFKLACVRERVTTKQAIINMIQAFGSTERDKEGD